MVKHERLYSTLLVVLAVYVLCGMGLLAVLMALPAGARPPTQLPEWSFPLLAFLNGAYFCSMVLTLLFRRSEPIIGRRLTKVLNVALLFGPPFGTVIGLYGLWKVDRAAQGSPA